MAGKVAPALAIGNAVIMKPAPQDPLAIVELARVLEQVGFPPGVVNLVNSRGPEPAASLTSSPDVDMVSFTGSTAVGQQIAAAGAPTMKRMLMEFGGKGAAVVFEDADIKSVVTAIGSTWAFHSGQSAPHRPGRSSTGASSTRWSAASRRSPDGSPSATPPRPKRWSARSSRTPNANGSLDHIENGHRQGEIVVGGGRPGHLEVGYYVEPTLITGSNDMTVAHEEIFGPVVVAIPFNDEEEGIAIANDYAVRPLRLRLLGRHRPRLPGGQVAAGRPCWDQHRPAQHGRALRWVQDERSSGRDGGDYSLEAYSEMQSIIWSG